MENVQWQKRRDILICIICAGFIVWAAWNFLNQFVEAVLLLLLSMAVAFLLSPSVNALEKRKVPRIVATLIVYVVVLAVIGALGYALIFSLIDQVQQFSDTIINFVGTLPIRVDNLHTFLLHQGIPEKNIQDAIGQVQSQAYSFAQSATQNVLSILIFISNFFLDIVIVLVVSFYLTLDGKRIRSNIINVVPQRSRPHVLLFEDALNRVVGNYIRGQLILAVIIGVMVGLVCAITGLGQFAIIFGVLGFLFETIPMVGPLLASISPLIASLLLPDPFPRTIYVVLCFVVIQALESNVLGPRIVGHAVGLHPVASIMALLVFARLFGNAFGPFGGAVGALVATPLVAAAWVVIASAYRSIRGETADQMLARKRAPWVLHPSTIPSALRFRRGRGHNNMHLKEPTHLKTTQAVNVSQEHVEQKQHIPASAEKETNTPPKNITS